MESEIWTKPHSWKVLWIYILLNVDHSTGKGFFNFRKISEELGISYSSARHFLVFAKNAHSISTAQSTRGTWISVLNWGKFQGKNGNGAQQNAQTAHSRRTAGAQLYNKNKNKEEEETFFSESIKKCKNCGELYPMGERCSCDRS